jgi:hypothetical protein
MPLRQQRLLLAVCVLIGAGVFFSGIDWGLPSKLGDLYFFNGHPVMNGGQIQVASEGLAAVKGASPKLGADVDRNPRGVITQPVLVNPKDDLGAKAEIVRRYRLFSYQPDEMITFMALRSMQPAKFDFDPHLYQYGGLWIYPVALCLKVAETFRLVEVRSGDATTYYLDHPEVFGRFYIVARAYVAVWGLIGVMAVFGIVRRITQSPWAAAGAAIAFCFMPVVVNMAHEAKPHLPGMVLVLLAVLGGARYIETGKLSYAIITAVLCGAALGMVLSTLPVFSVLLVMVLLRPESWGSRIRLLIFTGLLGVVVYGITNPYVIYHLAGGDPEPFRSNMSNNSSFYSIGQPLEGLINVGRLLVEGASPPIFCIGLLAATVLLARAVQSRDMITDEEVRRRANGLLLAVPAVLTAIQASLVAAGKPGEFGRFLLLTDVFLAIEAFVLLGTYLKPPVLTVSLVLGLFATGWFGWPYLEGFLRDRNALTSRLAASAEIEAFRKAGATRVLISAEPAPYAVPPLNLFDWQVILVPRNQKLEQFAQPGDVTVQIEEGDTPISWADKVFKVKRLEPKPEESGL